MGDRDAHDDAGTPYGGRAPLKLPLRNARCAVATADELYDAATLVDPVVNGVENYRHATAARRPFAYGGGACTLLVRRIDDQVELLFHATPETGAIMTEEQAIEIADALTTAASGRRTGSR